jgi:hypothetical protein
MPKTEKLKAPAPTKAAKTSKKPREAKKGKKNGKKGAAWHVTFPKHVIPASLRPRNFQL